MEFHSPTPCPPIPDDLTIPQVMLDNYHPLRPFRAGNIPWLIDDATGREVGFEEVHNELFWDGRTDTDTYGSDIFPDSRLGELDALAMGRW